ncbi:coiled-coil domain-containing protein, partial [Streptomyces beijiangensis]|nr:hypothetical protein [Streptomyces beijiangensis]
MSGRLLRSICTAAMATVIAATPAFAAPVDPQPTTIAGALAELQTLYRQAEEASETYNSTAADLKAQTAATKRLDAQLAKVRVALAGGRDEVGRMAREQYQGQTGLSGYMQLLLARNPQEFLDQGHQIARASEERLARVTRLEGSEERAGELAARAQEALDQEQLLAGRQLKLRDAVQGRLKGVEALLASLTDQQLADVARLEQAGTDAAQRPRRQQVPLRGIRPRLFEPRHVRQLLIGQRCQQRLDPLEPALHRIAQLQLPPREELLLVECLLRTGRQLPRPLLGPLKARHPRQPLL